MDKGGKGEGGAGMRARIQYQGKDTGASREINHCASAPPLKNGIIKQKELHSRIMASVSNCEQFVPSKI